ncbi:MAG: hypothetical protein MUF64_02545 [Polyangiaceae bacterium]|jgi:hypothetical protein|nr:hypothetical protein [Polyangiaceae bacterium]
MIAVITLACSGGDTAESSEDSEVSDTSKHALTDVIKNSNQCDEGPGRERCINAAPRLLRVPARLPSRITPPDGVREEKEYALSSRFFFEETSVRQRGRISMLINRYQASSGSGRPSGEEMRIFLENIPVPEISTVAGIGLTNGRIRIYLDHDRFNGPTADFDSKDRIFEFDIVSGPGAIKRTLSFSTVGGVAGWRNVCPLAGIACAEGNKFLVELAGCKVNPGTGTQLCSAEVRIPLLASDFQAPGPGLQPGVGFAVTNANGSNPTGKFPEDLTVVGPPQSSLLLDRKQLQTILLAPPRGFPVKYMSWNLRRFGGPLASDGFGKVSNKEIGEFLAPYDIVAIQEGWDRDAIFEIFAAANEKRKQLQQQSPDEPYEPFLEPVGPVDFQTDLQKILYQAGQIPGLEFTGTNGGLWIFSRFRRAIGDSHIYDACRDEDCFRAKGVQWARFNINPVPSVTCRPPEFGAIGEISAKNCPLPPSGDHYVDVFNTHLQASGTAICSAQEKVAYLKEKLADGFFYLVSKGMEKLGLKAKIKADNNFSCDEMTASVRSKQLKELNSFIHSVTGDKPDRPVVVMGDLNLDGKTLQGEYPKMLETLRIGPVPPEPGSSPSDLITPFPDDWSFDIDHGDLVRQRVPVIDFSTGVPTGTFITTDGGTPVTGAPWAGNFDGNERYDYILLRPPFAPNDPNFLGARWLAATEPGTEIWSSPWPGNSGSFGGPPDRLSDHKPVVATIKHAPLEYAPNYHPNFAHRWEMRVRSVDATGEDDCFLCGALDPFVEMKGFRIDTSLSNLTSVASRTGATCEQTPTVSWPSDSCSNNWFIEAEHTPFSEQLAHVGSVLLYDADSLAFGDDELSTTSTGKPPHFRFVWNDGQGRALAAVADEAVFGNLLSQLQPIIDQSPVELCTRNASTNLCGRISFEEVVQP